MKRIPTRLFSAIERLPAPIVITGGHGMLGWDLARALEQRLAPGALRVLGRAELDVTDEKSVGRLWELKPKVVINSAAYTNVDGAETEREKAFAINVTGTRNLAKACEQIGARLVHFSTDQIFDGTGNIPWKETDPVAPSNYYAETKYLGEVEALRSGVGLVLRVQWLYGEQKDRFTALRSKEVFTPFGDQFGAPTWTRDVAQLTAVLIARGAQGLFHFAYDDYASWAQVYEFVKTELRLTTRLEPQKTAEVRLPAKRPLFSVMSNRKLSGFLGVLGLGGWREPLKEFLELR